MPRNGSGTYSLPAGNPVVTGTVISSTVHNNTMSDLETEMTNSVDKDGQTVLTGALDFNGNKIILDVDGDTSFHADTDDQIDVEIAGADDFQFTANTFAALSGSTIKAASGGTLQVDSGGSMKTDTISETTSDTGVTIDGLLIKDGGLDFSASADLGTATSEVFDDYEEGTFSPTVSASGGGTATYANNDGRYTKIGNFIIVEGDIDVTSWDSQTLGITIDDLPIQSAAGNVVGGGLISRARDLNITAGYSLGVRVGALSTSASIEIWNATTGTSTLQVAECQANSLDIHFVLMYRTT